MSRTRTITRPFAGIASGLLALSGALIVSGAIITSGAAPAAAAAVGTTTSITSDVNPAEPLATVIFTVTVRDAGLNLVPEGTVDVTADSVPICAGAAVNLGIATCSTNLLALGVRSMVATYNGTANYAPSTSLTYPQTIGYIPTITLTPSANPIVAGAPLVLTVHISGDQGTPTGTFQVNSLGIAVGNCNFVPLVAGEGTCTVSNLTVGNHNLYVNYYSGDVIYASRGIQAQYTQVITEEAPTTTTETTTTTAGGGLPATGTGGGTSTLAIIGSLFALLGACMIAGGRRLRHRGL